MKKHQLAFEKIKSVLNNLLPGEAKVSEDGSHLVIDELWIDCDELSWTIGYGLSHRHFYSEHDNMLIAAEWFVDLLTKRKRITTFFKGDIQFKEMVEIEVDKATYKSLGGTVTWFFPFWKRTVKKVIIQDRVLSTSSFQKELLQIYELLRDYPAQN